MGYNTISLAPDAAKAIKNSDASSWIACVLVYSAVTFMVFNRNHEQPAARVN